jgi:hypothetical protein
MTLDWVEGIGAADVEAIRSQGHDTTVLARRVLQLFLSHALRDGYFHGDMHQGNLKVDAAGNIVAFDFGIMGRIDDYTRRVYAEILIGFIRRDYRRVAEVHFEAGYVPARPRRGRLRPGPARRGRAHLRHGRLAHLHGPAPGLPLRGDRALRDADPDRAHPAPAHHGGGRGRGAHARSPHEHLGRGAARWSRATSATPWAPWRWRATSPRPPGSSPASPPACPSSPARR